jgi:hypothetical protein
VRAFLYAGIVGFMVLPSLTAQQPEIVAQKVASGALVAVQQDSISVVFNNKVNTVHVNPDTEIWRRGADLKDVRQLTLGDYISAAYTRVADDGAPVAILVVATEQADSVTLVPHHVVEHRGCGGTLVAVTDSTISVEDSGQKVCVMRVNANTNIWRGEIFHDPGALKLGDGIVSRSTVVYPAGELVAEEVWAEIAGTEGTIVAVHSSSIVVAAESRSERTSAGALNQVTVLFDAHTKVDAKDLIVGRHVRAAGLDLGHGEFRASYIDVDK